MKEDLNYLLQYYSINYVIHTIDDFADCIWLNSNTDEQLVFFKFLNIIKSFIYMCMGYEMVMNYNKYVQSKTFKVYT